MRGTGESGKPQGPYSTRQFADDVVAVLDHLSIERADVYGTSMGGRVAGGTPWGEGGRPSPGPGAAPRPGLHLPLLAARIPRTTSHVFPGARHAYFEECRTEAGALVSAFLTEGP